MVWCGLVTCTPVAHIKNRCDCPVSSWLEHNERKEVGHEETSASQTKYQNSGRPGGHEKEGQNSSLKNSILWYRGMGNHSHTLSASSFSRAARHVEVACQLVNPLK